MYNVYRYRYRYISLYNSHIILLYRFNLFVSVYLPHFIILQKMMRLGNIETGEQYWQGNETGEH